MEDKSLEDKFNMFKFVLLKRLIDVKSLLFASNSCRAVFADKSKATRLLL